MGKYLHYFDSKSQANRYLQKDYNEPFVGYVEENNSSYFNRVELELNNKEYVDLGLPSGTLWATKNIGAINPEDAGDYFAWGEIETKYDSSYDESTYLYYENEEYTKYRTTTGYPKVLQPEDDVAHVTMGGMWRMPTKADIQELQFNCTWTYTTLNGVNGFDISGNNNHIFLPITGKYVNDQSDSSQGYYWTSLLSSSTHSAIVFMFDSYGKNFPNCKREVGCTVRGVVTPIKHMIE